MHILGIDLEEEVKHVMEKRACASCLFKESLPEAATTFPGQYLVTWPYGSGKEPGKYNLLGRHIFALNKISGFVNKDDKEYRYLCRQLSVCAYVSCSNTFYGSPVLTSGVFNQGCISETFWKYF